MEEGIPKEVIKQLDIRQTEKEQPEEVTAIVESHQIKLSVPAHIKIKLKWQKGQKCTVTFNEEKKEIIYKY